LGNLKGKGTKLEVGPEGDGTKRERRWDEGLFAIPTLLTTDGFFKNQ